MHRYFVYAVALLCTGCASPWNNTKELTAEQLQAIARDKASVLSCTTARYLTGSITTVFISIDMSRFNGVAVVTGDCNATAQISKPE